MGLVIFLILLIGAIVIIFSSMPSGHKWVNEKGKKIGSGIKPALIVTILAIILFIIILIQGVVIVRPGTAIVKFNQLSKRGNLSTLTQGFHIIVPFIYKLDKYDIRIQEYTMSVAKSEGKVYGDDSVWSPTKEGLQVGVDLTLWFRLDTEKLVLLHKTIGENYEEKILRPAIRSLIRNTVSQYKVMELYSSKRAEVQEKLFESLKNSIKDKGIIIDRLLLRDIVFPKEFQRAIEEKQIAEQHAQKMEYVLDREQKEAERKKIEASGEVSKIQQIGKAIKQNPGYSNWLYVNKLSNNIKVIVTDQTTIMNLEDIVNESQKGKR
jgi:regulator of protease activity HflC (stomatin/prohibitin superfamily)